MSAATLSRPSMTLEDAYRDTRIQQWLKSKGWKLEAPCFGWNYWHIELGQGAVLPVTPFLLMKMYLKDCPTRG
ncbi:hypothetical protein BST81_15880 [Leptolyngbya sp. 'hensonii']|uniref:hypothetical protein n=1 Tax=Leptolyngbya sp. 'hensonii' TaxID=1922337 RepID=UPI00094F72F4|nr:hypothetical protein [Leptolyngbya sp. 'hensonii']OLP17294.1 hypothetical protein BST81_15880 [Leptolyngbya sp. 'hensonii']